MSFYWRSRISLSKVNRSGEVTCFASHHPSDLHITLLMSSHVSSDTNKKKSHLPERFMKSINKNSWTYTFVPVDQITYGNQNAKSSLMGEIAKILDLHPNNLLVFDANHYPENEVGEFSRTDLLSLAPKTKIVGFIFDYYKGQPERVAYWINHCDVLVIFTPCISRKLRSLMKHPKIIVFPFTPLLQNDLLATNYAKERIFFYDGSNARHRSIFLSLLQSGNQISVNFHESSNAGSISNQEYSSNMSTSLLTFTNGFTVSGEHMVTDRVNEALLVGCLPICESSKSLDFFLKKYRHFFPVKTRVGVALAVKFFAKNTHLAIELAKSGKQFTSSNYNPTIFWHLVLDKIYNKTSKEDSIIE